KQVEHPPDLRNRLFGSSGFCRAPNRDHGPLQIVRAQSPTRLAPRNGRRSRCRFRPAQLLQHRTSYAHSILNLCAPDRASVLALAILHLDPVADLHLVVMRAIGRNIKTSPPAWRSTRASAAGPSRLSSRRAAFTSAAARLSQDSPW